MAKAGARNWLKGTALASDFGLAHRSAAEYVFKWGTNVPRAHALNLHAQRAADAIRQDTDGQFELQLFPNNELGGDTSMFSQLRSGEMEYFTLSGVNVLSAVVPAAAIPASVLHFRTMTPCGKRWTANSAGRRKP